MISFFSPKQLKVPYEVRGAQRNLEFAVLSLSRHNEMGRKYFLCLDNRPFAQLKDCDMTNEELLVEQKSFYDELRHLMGSNENCKFLEHYELLQFKGMYEPDPCKTLLDCNWPG